MCLPRSQDVCEEEESLGLDSELLINSTGILFGKKRKKVVGTFDPSNILVR